MDAVPNLRHQSRPVAAATRQAAMWSAVFWASSSPPGSPRPRRTGGRSPGPRAGSHDGPGGRPPRHGPANPHVRGADGPGRSDGAARPGARRRDRRRLHGHRDHHQPRPVPTRLRQRPGVHVPRSHRWIAFDILRARFGLEHRDTAYALLVIPTYVAFAMLNLALVTVYHPGGRSRILRDTGLPSLPLEVLSGLMVGATVRSGLTRASRPPRRCSSSS